VGKAVRLGHLQAAAGGEAPAVRIYVTGRVFVEHGDLVRDEASLPGRQGRLLLCFLVLNHGRPLARHELVNAVWGEGVPEVVDASLNALVSKLRRFLNGAGLNGAVALEASFGSYRLQLPAGSWVDIDQAELSFHEAESAARSADMPALYASALVAGAVARRPFLAGESIPWVVAERERLRTLLVRSLDYQSDFYQWHGERDVALKLAQEAVAIEPFRETGHQRLMRLLRDQGNRAESLRVYERCRRLLRDELGVSPSAETEALYVKLLKG
jgi:DNA-binding SARP family transcriptional activator